MGFLDRFKGINYEERAEVMRSSCCSFAVDIMQKVLPTTELSTHSTNEGEPIIFGMFIINHIYYATKGESETTKNQLKKFHFIMDDLIVNEIYLKKYKLKSNEVVGLYDILSNHINKRYGEYDRLLQLDIIQVSKLYRNTIRAFANNFFAEEIDEDKLTSFMFRTALLFAEHSIKCRAIINQW